MWEKFTNFSRAGCDCVVCIHEKQPKIFQLLLQSIGLKKKHFFYLNSHLSLREEGSKSRSGVVCIIYIVCLSDSFYQLLRRGKFLGVIYLNSHLSLSEKCFKSHSVGCFQNFHIVFVCLFLLKIAPQGKNFGVIIPEFCIFTAATPSAVFLCAFHGGFATCRLPLQDESSDRRHLCHPRRLHRLTFLQRFFPAPSKIH